jgi:integrase
MALSDTWLKANNNKAKTKTEERSDRDGLSVRVSPKGKITFQMRYRFDGKAKRLDIGSYPLMSLKDARIECQRLRAELEKGYDPKITRLVEKQEIINAETFSAVFDKWYDSYCSIHKSKHVEIKRSFELYALPSLGKLPIESVGLHAWLHILERLAKNKPSIADRLLTNGKQMHKWAVKRKLATSNPISDINAKEDLYITKKSGDRFLDDSEINLLWQALENSRMAYKNKLFLKLNLLYGCRNGELRKAQKKDLDFDLMVWTIPKENHKLGKSTGKPLKRPIIKATRDLLDEAISLSGKGPYLFNNSGSDEPMGEGAALPLPYNIMQWLRKNLSYEMKHWSVHDLRKTARTNFSTLTEPHIAEIMLGHKLPGHWQTYDHHDYLKEQATAYEKWANRLQEIVREA